MTTLPRIQLRNGNFLSKKLDHLTDIADTYYPEYNHNFTSDYYQSIASNYGLHVSNELSWPTFLIQQGASWNPPVVITPQQVNDAYTQQSSRCYSHGIEAMFVTNWNASQIMDPAYDGLMTYISTSYHRNDNTLPPSRTIGIYLDPWNTYSLENVNSSPVPNLTTSIFNQIGNLYNNVSQNGMLGVQFVTPQLLSENALNLNSLTEVYLPASNLVISEESRIPLQNIKEKLVFETINNIEQIGSLNEYQQPTSSLAAINASDLLWIDKLNKFPNDISPNLPGLQVSLSATNSFTVATLWENWSGLESSKGHFVGDFDGDGFDDFLELASDYTLVVSISNGDGTFASPQNWGGWGADGEDLRIGDFNNDGRDDILWVDKLNKYPNDVTPNLPGLQVTLSSGSGFAVATLWSSWGGLETSRGYYVGDFNGDGFDDFLNFANDYSLQVVVSNGSTNFSTLQNWGGWGADGEDLRIGDFNNDGRDDILWVDKLNKYPNDVTPNLPGLQVTLSSGSGFAVATLWSGWGGLETSRGYYVGDFNEMALMIF